MKPRRLSSETKLLEQQQDTYPYGKNGIRNVNIDAVQNEPGFLKSNVAAPYPIIGVIETDKYPVYFSTNNVNSAIGFHNLDTDTYEPIVDDISESFKLKFNINRPIKGEYRRNYKNEIELVWIELGAGANPPRWANTVTPGVDLNDFLLFPKTLIPYITTTMQPGGNLGMGAYYFALRYIKNDGTETGYTTLTSPLIAFSDSYTTIPGTNTGKCINVNITGLDTTFDRVGLVVVELINGVHTPYELPEMAIASSLSFVYTGAEKGSVITMDEVLTPSAYYENAQAITQLLDQLFLANMTEEAIIDWQQYATLVNIRWKSELVNAASRPVIATESGKQRGFMHGEAYCFYMVLKLRNGRNSRAFVIPGPASLSSDLLQSSEATAQGIANAPVYSIEDTCRNVQPDGTGDCGVWINLDETYPDIPQFDSSGIGGENLRNQPVRHHKMPSINFCKQNIYSAEPSYGREKLDTLGLEVTNVIIPANLQPLVIGWEIHYAKRDFNNATVLGQSLLMFGAQANQDAGQGHITSTGGNWGSYQRTRGSGATTDPESLKVTPDYIRFHAFDLLYFKPSINPTHVKMQLQMIIHWPGNDAGSVVPKANVELYDLDYANGRSNVDSPQARPDEGHIYKIVDGQYVVTNSTEGDFSNLRLEGAFVGRLPNPGILMTNAGWSWAKRDYTNGNNNDPLFELTYLSNLELVRRNVYLSYFSQTPVRTGSVFPSTQTSSDSIIYGGDTFVSEYSFITYGLVTRKDVVTNTGIQDWKTQPTDGIKTNHRFICETVADVACRYQLPGNTYSAFWPQTAMDFLSPFSRDNEPNQIGYSRDCNAVGDQLNGILIASPYDQFVQSSPTKIVRSQKQLSESVINSWKNFAALDYYEAVKNKGPIINLCGMNDRLIIHHQNALYLTRSKAKFSTDITEITLGTGDIFQFDPNEVRPAKLGYGGTMNPLACQLTPIGYMFPDNQTGELFLFDGNNLQNIGSGLITFLLKYMTVKEINSFIGNGISIGYEQVNKRILLTVKNKKVTGAGLVFVPGYASTTEFYGTLTPNVSVVYKDGRYQLFKGVNTSIYNCSAATDNPALGAYTFTSNEHVANGTAIGTVTATGGAGPYTYILLTTDTAGLGINPLTGVISVINTGTFDYTRSLLNLSIQVTDSNGNTGTGSTAITIHQVQSTPALPAYNVTIPEDTANGTNVQLVAGSNRDGGTLSYSIIAGNSSGAFAINSSTGQITVADTTQLDFFGTNPFLLTVQVVTTASGNVGTNIVTVSLSFVHEAPIGHNSTNAISQDLPNSSVVGSLTPATQRIGQSSTLAYVLASDSTPAGAFAVDLDPSSPNFLQITVLDSSLLDYTNNPYVITFTVYDPVYPGDTTNFTVSITVIQHSASLQPNFGMSILSFAATGMPSFTLPVSIAEVLPMIGTVPAQTFVVGIDAPPAFMTVKLILRVNGIITDTVSGITIAGSYNLVLPSSVPITENVDIYIST